MQDLFAGNKQLFGEFRNTVTEPRLTRYTATAGGDSEQAIRLYYWNAKLAESSCVPLHIWEIALRNRLNSFMCFKYGPKWAFDEHRGTRQLSGADKAKVREAVERQRDQRQTANVPLGAVVADLSAGFWVSLLSKRYEVPFVWRYNLERIFPKEPKIDRDDASAICGDLLDLRNRVAHHEPIFHLPLQQRRDELDRMLKAMCPASHQFASVGCSFATVLKAEPKPPTSSDNAQAQDT